MTKSIVIILMVVIIVFSSCDNTTGGPSTIIDPVDPSLPTLVYTASSLPDGQEGQPYTLDIGTAELPPGAEPTTISYTIVYGGLPVSLTLSGTGLISGTPAYGTVGTRSFSVRASADGYNSKTVSFSLSIAEAAYIKTDRIKLYLFDPTIRFGIEGGLKSFYAETSLPLEVESNEEWCKIELRPIPNHPLNWVSVDVRVGNHRPETSGREATVTITGGGETITIAVKQPGTDSELSVSSGNTLSNMLQIGGSVSIKVYTNYPLWTFESNQAWCVVTREETEAWPYYGINITVPETSSSSFRSAAVTLRSDDYMPPLTITVGQYGLITSGLMVGSYYYTDGTYSFIRNTSKTCSGIVYYVEITASGTHAMAVSLDELYGAPWAATTAQTLATNLNSGSANQAIIEQRTDWQTLFPAFAWCSAHGPGWFMPSRYELGLFNSAINARLEALGATPFTAPFTFWSSSEYTSNSSWAWAYVNGSQMATTKSGGAKVRAIIRFNK